MTGVITKTITYTYHWEIKGRFRELSGPVLRDTARLSQRYPPIARYGVFGLPTWPKGCDTPSSFSGRFPLGEHAKWRCDTPPQKGYLSDTCAIPHENKGNGCDTPLCDTSSKRYCAIRGGISHWAAKFIKGWFWRMYPRSSFRSGGTCERTLVPVFRSGGTSECTLVPVFVPGEHPPKPPFWKPPFCQPTNLHLGILPESTDSRAYLITLALTLLKRDSN